MVDLFPGDISNDHMSELLAACARLPDDVRLQAKFDLIIALIQGESGNFTAGILISVLAAFATTMVNQGFDPFHVLLNINKSARDETRRLLKEGGITAQGSDKAGQGTKPN